MARHFGHIDGIAIGANFDNRKQVAAAHIHRPLQAGISGSRAEGADSIVLSGGYADDADYGTYIIYTGAGGNDGSGRQIADQDINHPPNAALIKTQLEGYPLRVVRGAGKHTAYGPSAGYRYAGLFNIVSHWTKTGQNGFKIIQFRLEQTDGFSPASEILVDETRVLAPVELRTVVSQRQVRSSAIIVGVKELHAYRCQVCAQVLEVEGGFYAEGAHIRGLGQPHRGPDVPSNVLCLCPNDHVRFDYGSIYLSDKLEVVRTQTGETINELRQAKSHHIDLRHVAYHRALWGH